MRPTLDHQNVQRWFELLGSMTSSKCRLFTLKRTRIGVMSSATQALKTTAIQVRDMARKSGTALFAPAIGCLD
jgi:hypothetical protein